MPIAANQRSHRGYRDDLAYIHDAGFGGMATSAAGELIGRLHRRGIRSGVVVDLGCGSGLFAEKVSASGFDVLGLDRSASMIALSRKRVAAATFRCESFVEAELPSCVAATAIGEVFNYLFDATNTSRRLQAVFRRVYDALQPGGLFLFDVATPGRVPGGSRKSFFEGEDWACLVAAEEDRRQHMLTRRITSFRRIGKAYRREEEIHRQRLYAAAGLAAQLRTIGFAVRRIRRYGELRFGPGLVGFAATK